MTGGSADGVPAPQVITHDGRPAYAVLTWDEWETVQGLLAPSFAPVPVEDGPEPDQRISSAPLSSNGS